jgi:hypothetical protein
MSTELAIQSHGVQLRSLTDMAEFAATVHRSKLAPKDFSSPEAILVAMQHGIELGLAPMQAIQSIAVINGRPVVWGDAALALVKAHPEHDDVIETFEEGNTEETKLARCEVKRKGKAPVVRTFSVANATRAGLWGKAGPWTQYPRRMLQMRARSWAIRDAFPDALKGVSVREEVDDFPAKPANIREVTQPAGLKFADEPEKPALPAPKEPEPSDNDLDQLPEKQW